MRVIVTIAVAVALALTVLAAAAGQPPTVAIPDVVTLPTGESVTFSAADGATLTVTSGSSETATVAYDGAILTIAMRSDIGNITPEVDAPEGDPEPSCSNVNTQGTDGIVQCYVQPSAEGRTVTFYSVVGDIIIPGVFPPGEFEGIDLATGCNDVMLTYPPRTLVRGLAGYVRPFHALDVIWHYDAVAGRFVWWSPHAPEYENQYTRVSVPGESVIICVSEPATLGQPVSPEPAP